MHGTVSEAVVAIVLDFREIIARSAGTPLFASDEKSSGVLVLIAVVVSIEAVGVQL